MVLNGVQIAVVASLALLAAILFERPIPMPTPSVLLSAGFLGVVATALVLSLWLMLQPNTTATHAGLIFALEPVFASFFSWIWTGEIVTAAVWSGGSLMILGVLLAEIPLRGRLESLPFLRWLADDPMVR